MPDSLPSNQCPYCGYDTGHNEVCIAAERDRLRADVERLTRDLDAKDTEWRLQERLKDRAIAERDRLARENSRMRAGLELIAARDTPEGLIARETLAGRGPMPAPETSQVIPAPKLVDESRTAGMGHGSGAVSLAQRLRNAYEMWRFDIKVQEESADELERLSNENAEALQAIKNLVANLSKCEALAIELSGRVNQLRGSEPERLTTEAPSFRAALPEWVKNAIPPEETGGSSHGDG